MPRSFGLGEERMVGETLILQQGLQRAGAAAETESIDRQDGGLRIDIVALVAGGFVTCVPAPGP